MSRFFTAAALASLTLHAVLLDIFTVSASDTACNVNGAEGCSCQPYVCNAQNPNNYSCANTNSDCTSSSCYTAGREGSFEVAEGIVNATVCSTSGPLVGGGCSSGAMTYCKTIRSCDCDPYSHCAFTAIESGLFAPCTPKP